MGIPTSVYGNIFSFLVTCAILEAGGGPKTNKQTVCPPIICFGFVPLHEPVSGSVFRQYKLSSCIVLVERVSQIIALRVTNFSDADKRLCTDHSSAKTFPRTAVGKLCGLSITDAWRCTPVGTAWSNVLAEVKNKVKPKLRLLNLVFQRSSRLDDHHAPRIKENPIWKHLQTIWFKTRFQKGVSRMATLTCFQTQENNSFSIKIVLNKITIWEIIWPSETPLNRHTVTFSSLWLAKSINRFYLIFPSSSMPE